MKALTCTVCGIRPNLDIAPGQLLSMRLLLAPRLRATIGRLRDIICLDCQFWVARYFGICL